MDIAKEEMGTRTKKGGQSKLGFRIFLVKRTPCIHIVGRGVKGFETLNIVSRRNFGQDYCSCFNLHSINSMSIEGPIKMILPRSASTKLNLNVNQGCT